MGNEIRIRSATIKDAEAIAKIHIRTWQEAYKDQLPQNFLESLSIQSRIQSRRNLLIDKNNGNTCLIAEEKGTMIGFCDFGKSRDEDASERAGEIYAIYLDHTQFRKGVGSILLNKSLESLKRSGFSSVTLWVLTSNINAQNFYEKNGFVFDGKEKQERDKDITFYEKRYRKNLTI